LYVNGTNAASIANAPATPTTCFSIAGFPANASVYFSNFGGAVDEARVFTFAAGTFNPNQLLVNQTTTNVLTAPPSLSVLAPTLLSYGATFGASLNPNLWDTQVYFQYGLTTNYGLTTATNFLSGSCSSSLAFPVTGLSVNSTYHYRAVLVTSATTNVTSDAVLTTPAAFPPGGATLPATAVSFTSATLNGTVNPNGAATTAYFQYGLTTSYGSFSATNSLAATNTALSVSNLIAGLSPATTYQFRLVASNSVGTTVGANQMFTTPRLPVTNVITSLADSGAASLRDAILNSVSGDTIIFATNGIIELTSGEQLLVTNNLTINGPGATNLIISGINYTRIFEFAAGTTNSLSGLSLINGHAPYGVSPNTSSPGGSGGDGGAILNAGTLTVTNCTLSNNTAGTGGSGGNGTGDGGNGGNGGNGGGIYNSGVLSMTGCTLNSNTGGGGGYGANGAAGGDGGNGGNGGGICNSGMLSMTGCTFGSNTSNGPGPGGKSTFSGYVSSSGSGGTGGGICNYGTASLANCTFSGNSAAFIGSSGGGIFNYGAFTVNNCTLSGNYSRVGGGIYASGGTCSLRNILVALNTSVSTIGSDIFGSVTSQGHNLIGALDGSAGITNGVNFDLAGTVAAPLNPGLLPLGNYGGPTPTIALTLGSPAQDAGDDTVLNSPFNLATDQRGYSRKINSHVDIGAFELLPGDANYDGVLDAGERGALLNTVLGYYNNGAADTNVLAAVLTRLNGNGTVNQAQLNLVLASYYTNSPFLALTNVAGLGGTNVTFALSNSPAGAYSVQYSTNLVNWFYLGPATPRYLFIDTNAPAAPQRFYRLSYP
jgi:hypothetical protein